MRAVAFVADTEDGANRSRELLDAAKELAAMREADADSGPTAWLLEALQAIREHEEETIALADLLEALRARPGSRPATAVAAAGATSSRPTSSRILEHGTVGSPTAARSQTAPPRPAFPAPIR